ncbi:MAG: tetratricopeptide repeat protein [Verrucomicrobiae bacterium]|nr:tetratricopeptide repeat protein [Verrucomicrobiae bacterium]
MTRNRKNQTLRSKARVEHPAAKHFISDKAGQTDSGNHWTIIGACVFLVVITDVVFGQTWRHDFINSDDDVYVYKNTIVAGGLTLKGLAGAFNFGPLDNWVPLTTLSHMLDCQFFGLQPGWHHLTNLLLHAVSAVVLFLVLRQLTGEIWPSGFVATLFAIHPQHVESVAWVAERKDVLSGLFFMLTLRAYVWFVRRPASVLRYLVVLLLFACGLMSKPMLVTLPFILLLLDYWPLGRFTNAGTGPSQGGRGRLFLEKLPLFMLALAACVVTVMAQHDVIKSSVHLPLSGRLANAVTSYVSYPMQMLVPVKLTVFYPYPDHGVKASEFWMALLVLSFISLFIYRARTKQPYLLVGWLWYLGMLVPVIGLVQVGAQARADRYTYLPEIGLYLLLTWAVFKTGAGWPGRRWVLGVPAFMAVAVLTVDARMQTAYWRNSESLWAHTLAVTTDNSVAHYNLGNDLLERGQIKEAIEQYDWAVRINPQDADAHNNLGSAFLQQARYADAAVHLQKALALNPADTDAYVNLGNLYFQQGQVNEAITNYQQALQINPDIAEAHNNLGSAFFQKGNQEEAVAHLQRALEINPQYLSARANLAWLLATSSQASIRDGPKAVQYAQLANQASGGDDPMILRTLAAADAENGRFTDAVSVAQKALRLATQHNNPQLAATIQMQLNDYAAGRPFHLGEPAH